MQRESVRGLIPEGANLILGQSHFIKTVEDLSEGMVNTVPRPPAGRGGPCKESG